MSITKSSSAPSRSLLAQLCEHSVHPAIGMLALAVALSVVAVSYPPAQSLIARAALPTQELFPMLSP